MLPAQRRLADLVTPLRAQERTLNAGDRSGLDELAETREGRPGPSRKRSRAATAWNKTLRRLPSQAVTNDPEEDRALAKSVCTNTIRRVNRRVRK